MAVGYIKLYRKIQSNDLWRKETFNYASAWIDLLLSANWQDGHFYKRNIRHEQKRGQVAISIKGLADRWKWSQGKVKRFLDNLKTGEQIEYQTTNVTTIITILNYDQYQGDGDQTESQTESKRGTNGEQTESKRRANGDNIRIEESKEGEKGKERKKTTDEDIVAEIDIPTNLDTSEVRNALIDWLAYKRGRGETYKQPVRGLKMLLKKFTEPEQIPQAVEESIGNNWAGCFPPKQGSNKNGSHKSEETPPGLIRNFDWGSVGKGRLPETKAE